MAEECIRGTCPYPNDFVSGDGYHPCREECVAQVAQRVARTLPANVRRELNIVLDPRDPQNDPKHERAARHPSGAGDDRDRPRDVRPGPED